MGLWNYLRTKVLGVDLDATQATLDQTDAANAVINQNLHETGALSDEAFAETEAHRMAGQIDVGAQVEDAFNQSIQDTVNSAAHGVNSAIKAPFNFAWKAIPWEIWVIGAIVLFFYLGGFIWLRGILAKR